MDAAELVGFVPTYRGDTYDLIDPTKSNLSGKYVLITGASKGIGQATALSFAKAGASGIALLARSELDSLAKELVSVAKQAGRPEPKIITASVDVTDRASVEAAASKVTSEFGQLDILINNAGYLEKWKPMHESDPEDWWKSFDVNVKGVYLVTRAFLPLMLKAGDKTIINVSSVGGVVATPSGSGYQISKQAVIRMTDFITAEYGDQGVLSFAIHPGGVATELAKGMPEAMHQWLTDKPEVAADVLVYLTREKQTWLDNRFLSVNWDMAEFFAKKDEIVAKELLKLRLRMK